MIQVSCTLFAAGSIMAAPAKTFTLLLAGRTVMGLGGKRAFQIVSQVFQC